MGFKPRPSLGIGEIALNGFELNNKSLRRAGLDYKIDYMVYDQFRDFIESQNKNTKNNELAYLKNLN